MIKYLEYLNVNIECSHCDKRDHAMVLGHHDDAREHFRDLGWLIQDKDGKDDEHCPSCAKKP